MRLQILHVPGCPGADLLETRLAPLLAAHPGIELTRQVLASQADAERAGMTGSPTLLADGTDPFARPGQGPRSRVGCTPTSTAARDRRPPLTSSGRPLACDCAAGPGPQSGPGRCQMSRSCMSSICRSMTSRRYSACVYGARSRYRFLG